MIGVSTIGQKNRLFLDQLTSPWLDCERGTTDFT